MKKIIVIAVMAVIALVAACSASAQSTEKQYRRVQSMSELSDAELVDIQNGDREILDTKCRDYDGNSRQHLYGALYGGARFGEASSPLFGARVGYKNSSFQYELDAHYVQGKYVDGARAEGERYNSFALEVRFGYELLHDKSFKKSLSVKVGAGGEYQENDKTAVGGRSQNLAFVAEVGLEGYVSLSNSCGLFLGGYFGNVPHVEHNSWQELNHYAGRVEFGVRFNF